MTAVTGAPRLIRLALRRDRILLPVWIVTVCGLAAGIVASVSGLYADGAERHTAAAFTAANPVSRVFDGPASGTDIGAMTAVEGYGMLSILVALMSAQAVVRHTRLDEETGRAELLGSAVVGRHARLSAALVAAAAADLVVGTAVAAVLAANGLDVTGALATGGALAGVGMVFAGVAAVTSQIFATARGANGAAGAVLGVAVLLRAIGDARGTVAPSGVELISAWPSWLSPIGWGQQVRPFHQDNVEVFGLFAALAVVLVAVSFVLTDHRDVGAGMIPVRGGPPVAPAALRTPVGLAWRLQRGILAGWAIGLVIVGAAFGAVGDSAREVMGISEQLEAALRSMAPDGDLVELFFTFTIGFLGIAAACYTVQALLRMRAEEVSGRLEAVLATATGRRRWLAGHAVIVALGTVGLLAVTGASGAVAYGAMTGRWSAGGDGLLVPALAQAPAALALGGMVVALFAMVPRWAPALSWAALGTSLVMGQLGALLELPQALLNISPFTHVPAMPAQPFETLPVAVLVAVAATAATAGVATFRRRDLAVRA